MQRKKNRHLEVETIFKLTVHSQLLSKLRLKLVWTLDRVSEHRAHYPTLISHPLPAAGRRVSPELPNIFFEYTKKCRFSFWLGPLMRLIPLRSQFNVFQDVFPSFHLEFQFHISHALCILLVYTKISSSHVTFSFIIRA